MLRALWFAVKVGLLVGAAIWVADHPGVLEIDWLGYHIRADMGLALLAALFFLFFILFIYRLLWNIIVIPQHWHDWREKMRQEKGYKALTVGLTAVASGDVKMADLQAAQARHLLPKDDGLPVLLEAQAARLGGRDAAAQDAFERLMNNKDTAFLGLRGMMLMALEQGDHKKALRIARQALASHPKQPRVLQMAYDMEIKQENWDKALQILPKMARYKVIDKDQAVRDKAAILLQQANNMARLGRDHAAQAKLKQAHKTAPSFVPAAQRLARHYLDHKKRQAAVRVLERAWKNNPHPDLLLLWAEARPRKKTKNNAAQMRWYERLVALNPDHVESQIAAAEAALNQQLWGVAEQYLTQAERLQNRAQIYRLKARRARELDRPDEETLWLQKADDATPDPIWHCSQTGRLYMHWAPIAKPHGSFNTIIWGHPSGSGSQLLSDRTDLLITTPMGQ